MSAPRRRPAPPATLRDRILAEAMRTPSPTRAEEHSRRLRVTALGVLATMGLFFATGSFIRGARPVEFVVFTAGTGLIAAILMTRASSSARSMLGRSRRVLMLAAVVVALGLGLAALAAAAFWPAHAAEQVGAEMDLACAALTLVQAMPLLLLFFVPRRGSDPVHPALNGAVLGMTAGAWVAAMAYLRCPHAAVAHCIVAHVAPMLVLAAAGALLGRALLKIR